MQAYGTYPSLCNTTTPTLLSETVQKQCKLAEAQARTWNLDFKKLRLLQFRALPQKTDTWVVAALLTTETWHVMVSPARYTGPVTNWHDTSIFWNCDKLWQITWKKITQQHMYVTNKNMNQRMFWWCLLSKVLMQPNTKVVVSCSDIQSWLREVHSYYVWFCQF